MDPPRLASIPVLDRAAIPPVDDLIPYTDPKDRAKAAAPKGKGLI